MEVAATFWHCRNSKSCCFSLWSSSLQIYPGIYAKYFKIIQTTVHPCLPMSFVQSRENRFYTGIAPGTRSFAYLHCRSDQDAPVNICQRPYVSNSFWCATDICALEPRATRTHGDRRYSFEIGSWPNSSPGKSMFHQYNPIYIYICTLSLRLHCRHV